jgi:hypothetical protein
MLQFIVKIKYISLGSLENYFLKNIAAYYLKHIQVHGWSRMIVSARSAWAT